MKHITTLLPITSILSIALLAGCTAAQTPVNTNETEESNTNAHVVANTNSESNTNEAENTNEVVDENTSAEGGSASGGNTNSDVESDEVDTSDWLTYTNEEYGFSFKYPEEWVISNQIDKLSINEQVKLNLKSQNYEPDGTYGDILYRPYVINVSYNGKPFNYYGSLLVNANEDEIFVDGIKSKKISGEVYAGGPSMVMINIPNVSNTGYLEVVLNVINNEYETIFNNLVISADWNY